MSGSPEPTIYELAGGMPAFERLVEAFYGRVAEDELLRPMYPDDLEPGRTHLGWFLAQYWGGGQIYSERRGHPRLRMRHASFPITPEAALRWAELMTASVVEQRFPDEVEQALLEYVARATPTLINQLPEDVTELTDPIEPARHRPDDPPGDEAPGDDPGGAR